MSPHLSFSWIVFRPFLEFPHTSKTNNQLANWIYKQVPNNHKVVACIHHGQKDGWMKPLVIEIDAACSSWISKWDVLSIQGSNGIKHFPALSETLLDLLPVIADTRTQDHFILVLPDDGNTTLRDKMVYVQPQGLRGSLNLVLYLCRSGIRFCSISAQGTSK